MSSQIIKFLATKTNYNRYAPYIKEHTISEQTQTIIKGMGAWYETHDDVQWEEFKDWYFLVHAPTIKPQKAELLRNLIDNAEEDDDDIDEEIVNHYIMQDFCTQLAEVALKGAEGEKVESAEIKSLLTEWEHQQSATKSLMDYVMTGDLSSVIDDVNLGGWYWRNDSLNKSVGSLRQGKLVCFAGRPNSGKTTFLASNATFLAEQIDSDQHILWFNNEEAGEDVQFRLMQAALQMTGKEIEADKENSLAKYKEVVGDKIKIINKSDINVSEVEQLLLEFNPAVIIFDQLWKVYGYENKQGNDTARLHKMFAWAREIAKEYAPVITVHQVNTEGDGIQWLNQSQLYLSGTVIQGEVDTLLLLGKSFNPDKKAERYLTVAKNKGAYGSMVDSSLAEAQFVWKLDAERAVFYDGGMR